MLAKLRCNATWQVAVPFDLRGGVIVGRCGPDSWGGLTNLFKYFRTHCVSLSRSARSTAQCRDCPRRLYGGNSSEVMSLEKLEKIHTMPRSFVPADMLYQRTHRHDLWGEASLHPAETGVAARGNSPQ